MTVNLGINFQTSLGEASGDWIANVENIVGSAYADILYGNSSNNTIDSGAGDDVIYATGGTDTIIGGAGNDVVVFSGIDLILDYQQLRHLHGNRLTDGYTGWDRNDIRCRDLSVPRWRTSIIVHFRCSPDR